MTTLKESGDEDNCVALAAAETKHELPEPAESENYRHGEETAAGAFFSLFRGGLIAPSDTTYDAILHCLTADTLEQRDELTKQWRDHKLEELNFIGVVGALLAGCLTSTGSWPTVLQNGQNSPWTVRTCWYTGIVFALFAVLTAAQQSIRLHRLSAHKDSLKNIRHYMGCKVRDSEGVSRIKPRRFQVYGWQASIMFLTLSVAALIIGMCILIWSSTQFGLNELRCIVRDDLSLYDTIIVSAKYGLGKNYEDETLRKALTRALKQCIAKHPVLSTVILDNDTGRPQLAQVSRMAIDDHLVTLGAESLLAAREGETAALLRCAHNDRIPDLSTRPPWRAYVSLLRRPQQRSTELLVGFSYSHAIADGKSGLLFHQSFRQAMDQTHQLSYDDESSFLPSPAAELFPPLEKAASLNISWTFLLGPLIGEYCPPTLRRIFGLSSDSSEECWRGARTRPPMPGRSRPIETSLVHRQVIRANVDKVLSLCRPHEVKLTGLLIVLTSRALAYALQARKKNFTSFKAETALDLRKCIPEASASMGNMASAVEDTVAIEEGGRIGKLSNREWATAKNITLHLQQASSTLSDQPVGLLRYLSDFKGWTLKKATQQPDCSFSVSNVGTFDDSEPHDSAAVKLTDMTFSQSADGTGAPFNLNLASAKSDGTLNMVMTWWPGMLGVEDEGRFMDEVSDRIVEELKAM
ncbi:hypothetical protein KC356_g7407 [Hortaea werneckii]|nr:hypothetical protein KC356_g7407 [Hortaea werneckii]